MITSGSGGLTVRAHSMARNKTWSERHDEKPKSLQSQLSNSFAYI